MLINSDRITVEDLELWNEYEELDFKYKIPIQKIEKAKELILDFSKEKCWCSCSMGKDSVVTAHLVSLVNKDIPIIFIKTKRTTPYCNEVLKVLEKIIKQKIIVIAEGKNDKWLHWGYGIKIADKLYSARSIRGVRADESSQRELSRKVHGDKTKNSCRPILYWSSCDIFAYLTQNELPVHPNYAMLGGGRWERDRIRVGSVGGRKGRGMGRLLWEREYYGDILNKLRWDKIH